MLIIKNKILQSFIGPIIISVLSLFIVSFLCNYTAQTIDPTFHILANRGMGKIIFMIIAISHVLFLVHATTPTIFTSLFQKSVLFLYQESWIPDFACWFFIASSIHIALLIMAIIAGYAHYDAAAWALVPLKLPSLLWGFVATFFLAWSEELIFRGAIYAYFNKTLPAYSAALITSLIFSLAHNIAEPYRLLTDDLALGIGLFLLGLLLNCLYIKTGALYHSMGLHAGLVFVKVFLRRIPCVTFLPWATSTILFNTDLRKALIVHIILIAAISFLMKQLSTNQSPRSLSVES